MNRLRLLLLATIVTVALAPATAAFAASPQSNDDNCAKMMYGNNDDYSARAEEQLTIPAGAPLKIIASRNGGVSVHGGDGTEFKVRVCKFAEGDTQQEADARLPQIHASANGGVLQASGPEGSN